MKLKPIARLLPLPAIGVLFILALIVCFAAYIPGTGGSFQFDDAHNLGPLAYVYDITSAVDFISLGNAGPLGRPVSLLSFTPQAYAWPSAPDVFLYTNICLHLLNGCLLALMLILLGRAMKVDARQTALAATATAAIWMLLPILASSSLMVVQRMTLLAGTFSLIGISAYLYFRLNINKRPLAALIGMTISLGLATLLATLSKENGALLPGLTLVIELTLLKRPTSISSNQWSIWIFGVLIAPTLAILAYLLLQLDYSESTIAMRGFTADERLLTQAHILWKYLYISFAPTPAAIGPFHDDHIIYRDWLSPLSLAATGGWLLATGAAIYFRRKIPLFSFAIFWYLLGHSLESSSIPLELYFEHRNYLPLIGPIYSAISAATRIKTPLKPYITTGLTAYTLVLATTLHGVTSTWGNPALASEMWAIYKPDSPRALSYLIQHLQKEGFMQAALSATERFLDKHPDAAGTRLQSLALSCIARPEGVKAAQIISMEKQLRQMPLMHGVTEQLTKIHLMILKGRCESLDLKTIYHFANLLSENPNYQASPVVHHNLHITMASVGIDTKDLELTMHHLEKALDISFNLETLKLAIDTLNSAGLYQPAHNLIQQAHIHRPRTPLKARAWDTQLAAIKTQLVTSPPPEI